MRRDFDASLELDGDEQDQNAPAVINLLVSISKRYVLTTVTCQHGAIIILIYYAFKPAPR